MVARIQRKRTKLGNPFVGEPGTTVLAYREWLVAQIRGRRCRTASLFGLYAPPRALTDADLERLRGKNLACWCSLDKPCHADVLLELANR